MYNGILRHGGETTDQHCTCTVSNGSLLIYPEVAHHDFIEWNIGSLHQITFENNVTKVKRHSMEFEVTGENAGSFYDQLLAQKEIKKASGRFTAKHFALIALAGIVITGLFFAAFYAFLPILAEKSVALVPVELEVKLGEQLAKVYTSQTDTVLSDSTDLYLQEFTAHLSLDTEYPIKVRVIHADEINAFALPGGNIFIYSGLLSRMNSHEELVALLGHEISHVKKRHSLKSMMSGAAAGVVLSAFLGDAAGFSSWVVSKAGEFKDLQYSRELELEADNAGLAFMVENHVDPKGMLRLLQLLQNESGESPALMKYLSTHPDTAERIKNIETNPLSAQEFMQSKKLVSSFSSIKKALR